MDDVLDRRVAVAPTVISKRMNQGALLVDSETGNCFELNRIAATVWSELERGVTPTAIADSLAARHGISTEKAMADLRVLVGDLLRQGLLNSAP